MTHAKPPGLGPLFVRVFLAAAAGTLAAVAGCQLDLGPAHDRVPVMQGECVTCHQTDYDETKNPAHAGLFPTSCADCHVTSRWVPATGALAHEWFPLTEGHANRECSSCHTVGYTPGDTPTDCVGCHRRDYDRSPYPGHNVFPTTCTDCHDTRAWAPSTFRHDWPLEGAHRGTPCNHCHTGDPPRYAGTPTACVDCHRADYERSPFPGHSTFPVTCADCHTTTSWRGPSFTHPWPLVGAHAWAPCAGCHTGTPPRYAGTPMDCVSCHRADYERSTWPGHNTYPTTCQDCHGPTTWVPATFTHPWPIDGAHVGTRCEQCHTGTPPRYAGTPTDCVGCHRADYDRSTAPGHSAFPTTCLDCHTTTTWLTGTFTHPWRLTGAHTVAPCAHCHTGTPPVYVGTPRDCVSCHRADYDGSTHPGHATYPTTCNDCHTTTAWRPSTFAHSWPLTGSHTTTLCTSCHTGSPPRYAGTPRDCASCHRADYDRSTFPGHSSFPTTCVDCHTTTSWRGATFVHPWTLTGAHTTAACAGCHTGTPPRYLGTPRDCVSCHRADYDASTYPGHSAFATTCQDCHSTTAWRPSSFSHPWPLAGAHATTACTSCHTGTPPRYAGTPTACYDCHAADYARSTFPGHSTYPHTCNDCHGAFTWLGATFTHPWPLVGAHTLAPCARCHTGTPPRYAGTSRVCGDCHADDFARSPYIPHPTFAGMDCATCHVATGWTPATRGYHNNAIFSITVARHNVPCLNCHADRAGNWFGGVNVNCTNTCHEHTASNLASHHSGVRGYPTSPTVFNFCMPCHGR